MLQNCAYPVGDRLKHQKPTLLAVSTAYMGLARQYDARSALAQG